MHITENEIEFSPLSIKGKKALKILKNEIKESSPSFDIKNLDNEDYFIDNFYVEPFTRFKGNNIIEDQLFPDDLVDNEYEYFTNELELLEKNFLDENMRLLWIYGTAGCGKTTFIHSFFRGHKDKIFIDFCDLENAKRRIIIKVNNETFAIENENEENNNSYRFAIRLISKILSFLNIITPDNNNVNNISILKEISKIYNEKIKNDESDSKSVIEFFKIISNVDNYNIKDSIQSLVDFFLEIIRTSNFEVNIEGNNVLRVLSDILLHVMLCKGYLIKKKCICVFDNIEYYISIKNGDELNNIISDKVIENILNSLQDSIAGLVEKFLDFDYIPKFAVVTRYATVSFTRNNEMDAHHCCDITKWFCPKEIYNKKIKFLEDLNLVKDDKNFVYATFKIIMDDCTRSKWSLAPLLSKFFNYNYRRLARIVLNTLQLNASSLGRFIYIWETRGTYGEEYKSNVTHLCRMFVVRLLLESINTPYVDNSGEKKAVYFNRLLADCELQENKINININNVPNIINISNTNTNEAKLVRENDFKTSYARTLLTILHRVDIEDNYENGSVIGVKYYSFESVINDLFLSGSEGNIYNIDSNSIALLSKIINLMNEITDETGWVPLTSIKSPSRKYNQTIIEDLLNVAIKNKKGSKGNNSETGIRITYAGQVFLMLMPEFEYFALRYCNEKHFLLTDMIKSKDGFFSNIETIKVVLKHVIACSYIIIKRDLENNTSPGRMSTTDSIDYERIHNSKSIYREKRDSKLLMHPQRIFTQHINYLNTYKRCLELLPYSELKLSSKDEKEQMLKQMSSLIDLYSKWDSYFKIQYAKYFDL